MCKAPCASLSYHSPLASEVVLATLPLRCLYACSPQRSRHESSRGARRLARRYARSDSCGSWPPRVTDYYHGADRGQHLCRKRMGRRGVLVAVRNCDLGDDARYANAVSGSANATLLGQVNVKVVRVRRSVGDLYSIHPFNCITTRYSIDSSLALAAPVVLRPRRLRRRGRSCADRFRLAFRFGCALLNLGTALRVICLLFFSFVV